MKLQKFWHFLFICALFFLMLALILYPDKYIPASLKGILLFANSILPAVFPFMFITTVLTKTNSVNTTAKLFAPLTKTFFNSGGASGYVYFLSLLSGSPVGSKVIFDLYESQVFDKNAATKTAIISSNCGPIFIIGSIGVSMLGSKLLGFFLYFVHILGGFLTGIIFRFLPFSDRKALIKKPNINNIIATSMNAAIISILTVGGFICIFYILIDILTNFNILSPLIYLIKIIIAPFTTNALAAKYAAFGLVEITYGSSLLTTLEGKFVLPLLSFLLAFGGVCLLMQQIVYLKNKVNLKLFLLSKLVHSILCFILCYLLI